MQIASGLNTFSLGYLQPYTSNWSTTTIHLKPVKPTTTNAAASALQTCSTVEHSITRLQPLLVVSELKVTCSMEVQVYLVCVNTNALSMSRIVMLLDINHSAVSQVEHSGIVYILIGQCMLNMKTISALLSELRHTGFFKHMHKE